MSEDVSATMRVGITVILVAALVATVLNLMVMSNSLLSGGQTTLQGGIDSVSQQEFASYDNTKVSGTQVSTALSLFQGRDVAILVQTKALATNKTLIPVTGATTGPTGRPNDMVAINYGALVTCNGLSSDPNNIAESYGSTTTLNNKGATLQNVITQQAKTAYLVSFSDDATATNVAVKREAGASHYTAYLHNTNGLVDSTYDIIGTTELGNAAYILSSARFSSVLIKDPTGSIIGIVFEQIQ